jgi:hypothetical protein
MTLSNLLREKKAIVLKRWLDDVQAGYAPETCAFLKRGKDRFSDPVGHSLRTGTAGLLDEVLGTMDAETACRHLDDIVRVRAVQGMTPSETVSFVFLLKAAARETAGSGGAPAEWADFDARVDRVALWAFDVYARCRDQLGEIRINEMKRCVAGLLKRVGAEPADVESGGNGPCSNSNGF